MLPLGVLRAAGVRTSKASPHVWEGVGTRAGPQCRGSRVGSGASTLEPTLSVPRYAATWISRPASSACASPIKPCEMRFRKLTPSGSSGLLPRYYQDVAVRRALRAIGDGSKRLLLALAAGTGKTYIARSRRAVRPRPVRRGRLRRRSSLASSAGRARRARDLAPRNARSASFPDACPASRALRPY